MKIKQIRENSTEELVSQIKGDRSGRVTNAKVKKGIHPTLDAEALRVVESMPDWSPGIQNGEFVRVMFTIPVLFKLARY